MRLTEANVTDYADTLVIQARNAGLQLDYSEDSIIHLERYFRISDDLLQLESLPEEQRSLIVFYGGCYLGEVMCRHTEGTWNFEDNWFDSKIVFPTRQGGIQIEPFQKMYRRVKEGPADH